MWERIHVEIVSPYYINYDALPSVEERFAATTCELCSNGDISLPTRSHSCYLRSYEFVSSPF